MNIDDRWLEWLDSKIALLINRTGVDPRDYGGKSYDEYVCFHFQPALVDRYFQRAVKGC
jgi:hypothetical protein